MLRPRASHLASVFAALASVAVVAACGLDLQGSLATGAVVEAGADVGGTDGAAAGDVGVGDVDTPDTSGEAGSTDAAGDVADSAPLPGPFVWAHTSASLYKFDLGQKTYTAFILQNCGAIQDLAVHPSGVIDAITTTALYRMGTIGDCTKTVDKPFPFTLSYAAANTVQPQPTLVAFDARDYVRFDGVGTQVVVKSNALAGGYSAGGDVACKGSSCYVSVVGNGCADCLHEYDATTGNFIKSWGQIGYAKVFGLACAGGNVYGFTDAGNILEMKPLATGLVVAPVLGFAVVQFIGAGSPP
jgi:hypothetical protein